MSDRIDSERNLPTLLFGATPLQIAASNKPTITPGPADVLLGRGIYREHEGTKFLLKAVARRSGEYTAAERSRRGEIIREIYQSIRDRGGRFLKRTKDSDEDWESIEAAPTSRGWVEVTRSVAVKKVTNTFTRMRNASGNENKDFYGQGRQK